jgi:hypothetical protein
MPGNVFSNNSESYPKNITGLSQKPHFYFTPKSPRGDFLIHRYLKFPLGGQGSIKTFETASLNMIRYLKKNFYLLICKRIHL